MNLLKKFFEFAIGNGIVLVLGLISSPIITRMINPTEMGKFSMFNTITNLIVLIVLMGLDQSYSRYYYEEDDNKRNELLKQCVKIPLVISCVIAVGLIFFYKNISNYIVEEESFILVLLVVIHLIFSILSRFVILQVRMKQKGKLYSLLNVLMKIFYLTFVLVLFFIFRNNYITLILATVISNIIVTIITIFLEKINLNFFVKKEKLNIKTKEIVKYGIPLLFSTAIIWVFQSVDRIAIKQFSGYGELGLYSGAMTIITLLNSLQGAFTTFWMPVAYEKYKTNPENKEFFIKINNIISIVMILAAVGLIASKDILILLLGEKYREAVFIFPYLVFMPVMYTISETTVLGINFKKKTKNHIYISIIATVFNVCGNLILVPKYGAKGAAISTGLAYIAFFILRTVISQKYYKVEYNLGKFYVVTIFTYIFAAYSSFHSFNKVILLLAILNIMIVIILYKNIFVDMYIEYKSKRQKEKNYE